MAFRPGWFGNIVGGGMIAVIVVGTAGALLDPANRDTRPAAAGPVFPEDLARQKPREVPPKPRRTILAADANGQFWIEGTANGTKFRFLADTGASDVVFSKRDARRLGLNVDKLKFTGRASTANGVARTAEARIARLSVGPFSLTDFPVSIIDGDLDEPLLGMTFLQRLNIAISNGTLTLSEK